MGITITKSYTPKLESSGTQSSVGAALSSGINDDYVAKLKKVLVIDEESDALCTSKNFYSTKSVSALGADMDKTNFMAFSVNSDMELIMTLFEGIDDFTAEIIDGDLILKTID